MGKRRQWLLLLVRRNSRRDKTNAMQLASLLCRTRKGQMATMNGIESPAEKSNVHVVFVSRLISRLTPLFAGCLSRAE